MLLDALQIAKAKLPCKWMIWQDFVIAFYHIQDNVIEGHPHSRPHHPAPRKTYNGTRQALCSRPPALISRVRTLDVVSLVLRKNSDQP